MKKVSDGDDMHQLLAGKNDMTYEQKILNNLHHIYVYIQKVFEAYANRKGVDVAALRFLLDGERISETDSPKMLELEDEDQIDCVLQQLGGCL